METPEPNDRTHKGKPPSLPSPEFPQPRARHYPRPPVAKRRGGGTGAIVRIVALGSWALIFVLLASMMRQLGGLSLPVPPPRALHATVPTPARAAAPLEAPPPADDPAPVETPAADFTSPPDIPTDTAPAVREEPAEPRSRLVQLAIPPAPNGNFFVEGEINRQRVVFMVDTGASWVAIPDKLRWKLNLTRGAYLSSATANGMAGMYATQIKQLSIGPLRLKDVDAVLNPGAPNEVVLLGMTALREVRLLQQGGLMLLQQEQAVDDSPAIPEAAPRPATSQAMKKSVKECMDADKVINDRVLKCMRGEDEAAREAGAE